MSKRDSSSQGTAWSIWAVVVAGSILSMNAGLAAAQDVAIDSDDIGGVVTGPNGPEAGVWVIAETTDLPTKYAKSVVTDDQGRYVVPDLPQANYKVWVRGYGLVDSPKLRWGPGQNSQSRGRAGPGREIRRALLSRDLLVLNA